jgi:hypothetical protein
LNRPAPVSRLRWVSDAITGAKIGTGSERAECRIDGEGHTLIWRVWIRGPGERWRPEPWRPPTSWMRKQREEAQRDEADRVLSLFSDDRGALP